MNSDEYNELKAYFCDLCSLVEYLAENTKGVADTAWIASRVGDLQKQVILDD